MKRMLPARKVVIAASFDAGVLRGTGKQGTYRLVVCTAECRVKKLKSGALPLRPYSSNPCPALWLKTGCFQAFLVGQICKAGAAYPVPCILESEAAARELGYIGSFKATWGYIGVI